MKTLSIQEPWAYLVCSGIKEIEVRTWKTDYRGLLLIHTGVKKAPRDFLNDIPLHWADEITNAQILDYFPRFEELPTSAIIGYVTLADCTEKDTGSIWDSGGLVNWVIKDAYLFDKPILGVRGKLNLYDTPDIDPDNLPPAHKVDKEACRLEGKEFIANAPMDIIRAFDDPDIVLYDLALTPAVQKVVLDNEGNLRPIETLTLVGKDKTLSQKLKEVRIEDITDEETGKPIHYTLLDGTEYHWRLVVFEVEK